MSLVLILRVFCVHRVYRGLIFFSLVLILHIPAYLGIKEALFFQIGVLQFVSCVQFYTKFILFLREIECIEFVCIKFILVLVQIDLIQFESTNCIRSICAKTNTNLIHTNSIIQFCVKLDTW
jgi:hypothetical protein